MGIDNSARDKQHPSRTLCVTTGCYCGVLQLIQALFRPVGRFSFDIETWAHLARNIREITNFSVDIERKMVRLQMFVSAVIDNVLACRDHVGVFVIGDFICLQSHITVRNNDLPTRVSDPRVFVFALLVGIYVYKVLL
jgi:hypothetical protein